MFAPAGHERRRGADTVRGRGVAPLKGLFAHQKGGFYHDVRFATLDDVVEHYDQFFVLQLASDQKRDLIEYLKSI